ncbi:MAG: adenylate/guanylate cyclase domain-containing protein [Rhodocyclales bacterium]|nr:adenylate/guanylate cyclase domain-containing protein [Rhodocyclales bacterium]
MPDLRHKRQRLWMAGLCLLIALLAEALFRAGWVQVLETAYSDLSFRLSGKRATVEHVALVELDDESLALHPDDPLVFWTPHFARALQVLRAVDARLVGMDFLFSVSPEQWFAKVAGKGSQATRSFDRSFRQELATGRVVLGGMQTGAEPILPTADYLAVLPGFDIPRHVGATDLVTDGDGTLRHMTAQPPGAAAATGDSLRLLPFSLLLALHGSQQAVDAAAWRFGERTLTRSSGRWPLAWSGPPDTVPRIAMRRLLAADAENDPEVRALRGKIVIIGVAYGGSNDVHMTPYGHGLFQTRWMRGPEIQAQSVEALLAGRFLDEAPAAGRWGLLALTLLLGTLAWMRLSVGSGALVLGGLLLSLAVAGHLLHLRLLLIPVAHLQLASIALFLAAYALRFTTGERERERVRRMFSRYVSGDVVKKLLDSDDIPVLGGEALEITVLFSDIRNFTTTSERLRPEEVVEMLNRWLERACAVVQAEGGSVDKFIGDAIMAEFGAPLHYPDHARRALRAALGLQAMAEEMRNWMAERFADRDLPPFSIGVGVHTGTAVVGNVGAPERMEYTAIGDTVNLASRLEGSSKTMHCTVVASRSCVDRAGGGIRVGAGQTLTVKGRNEPAEALAILGIED